MKSIKKLAAAAVATLALGFYAGSASAAVCATTDVTTSTACQNVSGNDKGANGINTKVPSVFGHDDWILAWSSDEGQEAGAVDFGVGGTFTGSNGTWSVTGWQGFTEVLIAVKGGPDFAAYLLDTLFTSGAWSTAGLMNPGGNQPDLSHLSIWYRGAPEIPLPAAAWLMLAGIGGLGFASRRKKTA